MALGVVYEDLQDTSAAIACHLRRLDLAMQHRLTEELPSAYASLTSMFLNQAQAQVIRSSTPQLVLRIPV